MDKAFAIIEGEPVRLPPTTERRHYVVADVVGDVVLVVAFQYDATTGFFEPVARFFFSDRETVLKYQPAARRNRTAAALGEKIEMGAGEFSYVEGLQAGDGAFLPVICRKS